jgi:hypothetical protein
MGIVVKGRFTGGALFAPKADPKGKEQYTANIVLDDGEEQKLLAAMEDVIREKWGGKPPSGLQKWAVRKGDDEEYETSFGKWYVNAKAGTVSGKGVPLARPGTFVKRDGALYGVEATDDVIYPGCYVAIELSVYGYDGDKKNGIMPGITCGFNKVLFLKNGPRLSSQTSADTVFADFDSEETEDNSDLF